MWADGTGVAFSICENCSSHSGANEDFGLPRCNAVLIGVYVPTFGDLATSIFREGF
jgi:hypothetical protein